MASRRQFIQSGLVLSAAGLPGVSAWASPPASKAEPQLRFEHFIFDHRFAEAAAVARSVASVRSFASAARRRPADALRITRIEGDLTALWYDELDLKWKARPTTIGGVTTWHGLFVLETLAADRGMRVVYRGRHEAPVEGRISHALAGPADLVAEIAASDTAFWPKLGRALTRGPLYRATSAVERTTSADGAEARTEPLFSWIIAPRSAAAKMA